MSRANAASIAKTAVGHLAATARESFASANNDLIKGKQWLSQSLINTFVSFRMGAGVRAG